MARRSHSRTLLRSYEYTIVDGVVARVLETLRPHARQVTTHAVGLAERVEALAQLQPKARATPSCRPLLWRSDGRAGQMHLPLTLHAGAM